MEMCKKNFLFIGIGGMGMSPLALYLRMQGHNIWGYDDAPLPRFLSQCLENQYISVTKNFPEGIDEVVFSTAISPQHPMILEANSRRIKLTQRGIFLATLSQQKKLIAVVGSHGKTTTTAALVNLMPESDYILGGFFKNLKQLPSKYSSDSEFIICEVDESDRTIVNYHPYITLALNLENDHLINYESAEDIDAAFLKLFDQTQYKVLIPQNSLRLQNIAKLTRSESLLYCNQVGENPNMLQKNYGAAQAVCTVLNLTPSTKDPLPLYRRDESLGIVGKCKIIADYAHHPTKISAYLRKVKATYKVPLWVVFQPHRYTRTAQYAVEFASALSLAENVFLLPVYSAGESYIPNGTSENILKYSKGNFQILKTADELFEKIFSDLSTQECILAFIGAGDVYFQAKKMLEELKLKKFLSFLNEKKIPFFENYDLCHNNSFQIHSITKLFITPRNIEELQLILKNIDLLHIIVGQGSNLLFDDPSIVVISLKNFTAWITSEGNTIETGSGVIMSTFCNYIARLGFKGAENLSSIPGTVGGAIRMNAGTHEQQISDYLSEICFLDDHGNPKTLKKDEIKFSYRSGFTSGIVLSAKFHFDLNENPETLLETISENKKWRIGHQPLEPNAGSIFKNPGPGVFAGQLIEKCQLKGESVGGAMISHKHANFIINPQKEATANDVKQLIQMVQSRILEKTGIFLEREILFASDIIFPKT